MRFFKERPNPEAREIGEILKELSTKLLKPYSFHNYLGSLRPEEKEMLTFNCLKKYPEILNEVLKSEEFQKGLFRQMPKNAIISNLTAWTISYCAGNTMVDSEGNTPFHRLASKNDSESIALINNYLKPEFLPLQNTLKQIPIEIALETLSSKSEKIQINCTPAQENYTSMTQSKSNTDWTQDVQFEPCSFDLMLELHARESIPDYVALKLIQELFNSVKRYSVKHHLSNFYFEHAKKRIINILSKSYSEDAVLDSLARYLQDNLDPGLHSSRVFFNCIFYHSFDNYFQSDEKKQEFPTLAAYIQGD